MLTSLKQFLLAPSLSLFDVTWVNVIVAMATRFDQPLMYVLIVPLVFSNRIKWKYK